MKNSSVLAVLVGLALLVSLAMEAEAGVSFHPRPKEKSNNRSGNARKSSAKRQVYDDVVLQTEMGHSNSAVAQVEVPSQMELGMSKADWRLNGELLLQILSELLGSDSQES